jgi:toxin-antitoxin system PIN domain toxin
MIAIDTNVLVYAQRSETPHHEAALRLVRDLATGAAPWAVPWPCIAEFVRLVTHHRLFDPPTPMADALANLESLLSSPSLQLLAPTRVHVALLAEVLEESGVAGAEVRDAEIVAICRQHGVRELLTADRGFRLFRGLKVRDPFS